ncbi:hypothetical protein AB0H83_21675 [Dactylosporangium sp. NPDC050688]|uniref:hypothetical protein n=1 Tax=Dactylosporangium sp. NPDC050688 TaxID=3157217 RepID=UPI0033F2687D
MADTSRKKIESSTQVAEKYESFVDPVISPSGAPHPDTATGPISRPAAAAIRAATASMLPPGAAPADVIAEPYLHRAWAFAKRLIKGCGPPTARPMYW